MVGPPKYEVSNIVFVANTISFEFSSVNGYFFYLDEYIDSDIPKFILNYETPNHKKNLFGGPHSPTYFGHSES